MKNYYYLAVVLRNDHEEKDCSYVPYTIVVLKNPFLREHF